MRIIQCAILISLCCHTAVAQDEDLLNTLSADSNAAQPVADAFKSTRVIMSHSMKMLPAGVLDFRILHRFGRVSGGLGEMFGLDGPANVRLGLDYGISNRFTLGIGRATYKKELDGFLKYAFVQQSAGAGATPLSLIGVAGSTLRTLKWSDGKEHMFTDKLSYYLQLIAGRKFSDAFTLQLSPTYLYRNFVEGPEDNKNTYALGVGSKIRLSKRTSLNVDYYIVSNKDQSTDTYNPLSIGFDIETGGHVFQLHFTNAHAMNEKAFLTETFYSWGKGDVEFGFNISRVFQLKKR